MKVSLAWLKELLADGAAKDAIDAASAARALTMVGLEVEGIEERGRALSGIVTAEVLAVRPHPGSDKLRLVRVRAGAREEEVVCGASNVPPPGHHVVWAPPGARLPDGRTLEAKEVRGVLSPGMLCSEPELGIGEKGEGILLLGPEPGVPSGSDFVAAFKVVDDIFEVNVTPNRADALSHLGIARELGAALDVPLRPFEPIALRIDPAGASRDVEIVEGGGGIRYVARVVTGLSVRESPLSMRLRLAACGVRPISNLVDVTNYVLLELGHPLHAFDLDKVAGAIRVRRATPGEKMVTLDGTERLLVAGDIVIADDTGPIALAGVMGGARTEVTAATKRVLLEAATFDPVSIRRTSKRLGLISEASYRFERGVDAEGISRAATRAVELLAALGGGAVSERIVDRYPVPVVKRTVSLPVARLARVSGLQIAADEAARELGKIAEDVRVDGPAANPMVTVTVPSYRPDLTLPEDLVEEVLRLGGRYEAPAQIERVIANSRPTPSPEGPSDRARDLLASAGLAEIVSWGFVARGALAAMVPPAVQGASATALVDGVVVENPISADYEVMRTSLLPGLAAALGRNLARGLEGGGFFEVGPIVRKPQTDGQVHSAEKTAPEQRDQLAIVLAGPSAGWLKPGEAVDFFDLKRIVEVVLRGFAADATMRACNDVPFLHPGVAAEIVDTDGRRIGCAGELDPRVARKMGLETRVLYAELDVAGLAALRVPVRGAAPPRFPAATRDLSFWIDLSVPAAAQREAFLAVREPLLVDLGVREDFRDPKYAPAGKKGMLWGMTYRAEDKTLTDAEVDAAHARVVAALGAKLTVQIR